MLSALCADGVSGQSALSVPEGAHAARGCQVDVVDLADADIKPCRGCGSHGVRTPGRCVIGDDLQSIYPLLVQAQLLVLAAPMRFGGHGAAFKVVRDRFQPLMAPFYALRDDEMNFQPRYPQPTRLLGVGLLPTADADRASAYTQLVEDHASNLNLERHATDVLVAGEPAQRADAALTAALGDVLGPGLPGAGARAAREYMPAASTAGEEWQARPVPLPTVEAARPRRVLLLQGSVRPKWNTAAIVAYVRGRLERLGVAVDVFTASARVATAEQVDEPFAAAMGWPWSGGVGFGGTSPIDGRPLDDLGGPAARLRNGLAAVAYDIAAGAPFSPKTSALCDRSPFPLPRRAVIWMINRRTRSKPETRS